MPQRRKRTGRRGSARYVYEFERGNKDRKDLLGGKGANLAEMVNLGLPVPPGFTITTEACRQYLRRGKVPGGLMKEVEEQVNKLEKKMGRRLGDPADPLLVSVRSGAKFSMPGMMDTVLNLGINDKAVKGLARQTRSERFALDAYRRFIQMFGRIVMGVEGELFEEAIEKAKKKAKVKADHRLRVSDLKKLVTRFKQIVRRETGETFPDDPLDQLRMAIEAVFRS